MKVLIVSHTVLSRTSNMGKTLLSYFDAFKPDELAQLYIHSEIPTDNSICKNYYRFTDKDALKSIISIKRYGTIFSEQDIDLERVSTRIDQGLTSRIYQMGRKRTGSIYLLRNLVWRVSHWFTKELKQWLNEFNPDVIFFASGDYAFMYDIARKISQYLKKPLVVSCMDDYYLYNKNHNSLIGRIEHRLYINTVQKTMDKASEIFCICDSMADEYAKLFRKKTYVIHTSAAVKKMSFNPDAKQLSYIGNLGYSRYKQIIEIGKVLRELGSTIGPEYVDVYSSEKNPEITKLLTENNGIRFHGQISADEVIDVMQNSMAVIHTEAFDNEIKERVRFSVSTKIAESLLYGPCLLAYGPDGIASIEYLKNNKAAYTITARKDLVNGLREFITDSKMRENILQNARTLGKKNHSVSSVSVCFRNELQQLLEIIGK